VSLEVRLPDWVARRARTHPAHVALEAPAEALTYLELERRVSAAAEGLRRLGAAAGEPVAVLMANGLEFAVFAHAVPRAGAAFMPLNARLTSGELAWQLRDAGGRWLVADQAYASAAEEAAAEAGVGLLLASDERWRVGETGGRAGAEPTHAAGDVHSVVYTSGTSGRPKGALLTFGNFEASAAASAYNLGLDPADRWLACLPLFHVGGLSILLRSAIYGTTAVIHERFDERAVNEALRLDGITLLSVVPTMLQRMFEADGDAYPSTLRAVLLGRGPASRPLLEEAQQRGVPVLQTYGLTETASQVTTLSSADALRKLGSAGQPLLGTSVRIEVDGRDAEPGEVGEILVCGATVTPGYLGRPDATAEALRDRWLRTGDLGYVDSEGYLTVADRRDDLIVSGGENVYPAEVESALLACAGVAECAVVGLEDARWGQVVAALVVPAEGASVELEPLVAELRTRLAGYKVPRRIEISSEALPRTASGKLLRRVVRERLGTAEATPR
jgi:O-succinylbenzoic acid--CoA ligase